MILKHHWPTHTRFSLYMHDPMLMLGAQSCRLDDFKTAADAFRSLGIDMYETLDPDGGDLTYDLNDDLDMLAKRFGTVYNLGTLEHVWDVHTAWANALRAVEVDGTFLTCTPIQGWDGHGIHITSLDAIVSFIKANGFDILEHEASVESRGVNLWLAAQKKEHIQNLADFRNPQQVYTEGRKAKVA